MKKDNKETKSTYYNEIADKISVLNDSPSVAYGRSAQLTVDSIFADKLSLSSTIRTGIPYSLFDIIQKYSTFSDRDWAEILDISDKSLHRYKQQAKTFRPLQSEKIIEIAEVTHLGLEVFGDNEKFKQWLTTPNFALGNHKPMELLKDSFGKELVVGELTRINHGIFV